MRTFDKEYLFWYIKELFQVEKDILVKSDKDIIHIEVKGFPFYLYIKSLTYAGNPYPKNTTRAQLPRRDEFVTVKENNSVFLFLGYDSDNEVFACWDPIRTKARLNDKQYVSFFSRLSLQQSVKKGNIKISYLQNDFKYALFKLDDLPDFILNINQYFPDIEIQSNQFDNHSSNDGVLTDINDDIAVKLFIDEQQNAEGFTILSLVSSCINEYGDYYNMMNLKDWYELVTKYLEDNRSLPDDDNVNEYDDEVKFIKKKRTTSEINNGTDNALSDKETSYKVISEKLFYPDDTIQLEHYISSESNCGLRNYLNFIFSYPSYSINELKILFERYRNGDYKSFELIVNSHLKYVVSVAYNFRNRGCSMNDLIQEGNLGLIRAIKTFDYTRNVSFIYYAKSWIFQQVYLSTTILPYLQTIPYSAIQRHSKLHKYLDSLEQKLGFEPVISNEEADELWNIKNISYIEPLPYDLLDSIRYYNCDNFESDFPESDSLLMKESICHEVICFLKQFKDRTRKILELFFGIGCDEQSLEQIGNIMNLTKERVRQIIANSIKELRDKIKIKQNEGEVKETLMSIMNYKDNSSTSNKTNIISISPIDSYEIQSDSNTIKKRKGRPKKQSEGLDSNKKENKKTVIYHNNYIIENGSRLCKIFDSHNFCLYSSVGYLFIINKEFYQIAYKYSYVTIYKIIQDKSSNTIEGNHRILCANKNTELFQVLGNDYFKKIEDIKHEGNRAFIKVSGVWYNQEGNKTIYKDNVS